MSELPKLRVVSDRSEIVLLLLRQYQSGRPLLLWQKDDKTNKRNVHAARLTGIDRRAGRISLGPAITSWTDEINLNFPIYLKGTDQELLFKLSTPRAYKGEIIADLPIDIRALEKRFEDRFLLDLSSKNNILEINKFHLKEKIRSTSVSVIDISNSGMGIVVPIHEQKYFYEGDHLFASGIRQMEEIDRLAGKIIHLKNFDEKAVISNSRLVRVGIHFENSLTPEQLNLFKKLSHK